MYDNFHLPRICTCLLNLFMTSVCGTDLLFLFLFFDLQNAEETLNTENLVSGEETNVHGAHINTLTDAFSICVLFYLK